MTFALAEAVKNINIATGNNFSTGKKTSIPALKIQFQNDVITVFESALYRTTSSVIAWGNAVAIIDPNWLPAEIITIRDFVRKKYPRQKQFLLFTHSDYDHILGYGAFPEAEVIAGTDFVNNPSRDTIIQQILDFDDNYYVQRNYPIVYPTADIIIEVYGQNESQDGEKTVFFPSPGHVNNGLITVFPDKKMCFAGDYLSNIEIPMVEHSFVLYEKTLQTFQHVLETYEIQMLVTGHGDAAHGTSEIRKRLNEDLQYIQSFLHHFNPSDPAFEACILSKGNLRQNRIIHENNQLFYQKTRRP